MPEPYQLYKLTQLRKRAKISLAVMARTCGLTGSRAYESASAWESGKSIPHRQLRSSFLIYLAHTLGLHTDNAQLEATWNVLVNAWGWEPLCDSDWQFMYGIHVSQAHEVTEGDTGLTPASAQTHTVGMLGHLAHHDALPPPALLPPGSRIPYTPNPFFVGRAGEIRALAESQSIGAPSQVPLTAVVGVGGIGKTQLVVEFAHRFGRCFAGGVFWLSCANPTTVPAVIAACGGSEGMGLRPDFDRLSLAVQVQLVCAAWEAAIPRLLIFDNCEEPDLVRRWCPQTGGCHVLITSRRVHWDAGLGVSTLPLGLLSRAESVALLRNHCPNHQNGDHLLTAIAAELDDLPLALHLGGSYLARAGDRLAPSDYLRELRHAESATMRSVLAHQSLQGVGPGGRPLHSPTDHAGNLEHIITLSYGQLDLTDPIEQHAHALLRRAACLAPGEPIPLDILIPPSPAAGEHPAMMLALQRLIDLGLCEESSTQAGRIVRVHRLVHAFLQNRPSDGDAHLAVEQTLLNAAAILNASGNQARLLQLQVHLRVVTDRAFVRGDLVAADLGYELSRHLGEIEQYAEAKQYNQRSLAIREHCFGRDDPQVAENLHYQGDLLDWQGDYAAARPYHFHALEIRRRALGDDHSATATSLNHVGEILHALCDYPNAHTHYQQALDAFARCFGPDHPAVADVENNLGLLLNAMGMYAVAQPHAERAVAIWERSATLHSPRQSMALNNLGYVLRAQGHYGEARPFLERALAIREVIYGPANTAVGVTLNHLGRTAYYLGDLDAAQRYLERAMTIFSQSLGEDHPITASTIGNLGMLYLDRGNLAQAQPRLEHALAIHQRRCGPDHRHTGRSANRLGVFFAQVDDAPHARAFFELALTIRERVLGQSHHDTANTYIHLGTSLLTSGEISAARLYIKRGLDAHLQQLGIAHHYTARSLLAAGRLLQATGDYATAQAHYNQALSIYRQTLGEHHPFTVKAREIEESIT